MEGRTAALNCSLDRASNLMWAIAVFWRPEMNHRQLKQAKKRKDELVGLYVNPELQGLTERYGGRTNVKRVDSLGIGASVFLGGEGDPPAVRTPDR